MRALTTGEKEVVGDRRRAAGKDMIELDTGEKAEGADVTGG